MTYSEKLKDKRWLIFREQILESQNYQCQVCGTTEKRLDVHHGYYETGLEIWDYDPSTMWCLCRECHETIQNDLRNIHKIIALVNPAHLRNVVRYVKEYQGKYQGKESPYFLDMKNNIE